MLRLSSVRRLIELSLFAVLIAVSTFSIDTPPAVAAEVTRIPVNLAAGKPTQASSEQGSNKASCAVDGQTKTRWCAANSEPNHWWQVDLGQSEPLTGCRLDWEGRSNVYRYKVEGSSDAKQWTLLVDGSHNTRPGTVTDTFKSGGVRYVRVTFLGTNTGGWGSLWDVQVLGEKTVAIDPQAVARQQQDAILDEVKVPEGFAANVFAAPPTVNYPVFVAAAPDGVVYVSSDKNGSLGREPNRGSILRVRDVDGDGRADEVKRFVPNVDSPRGLVWDRDRLYLMHPPHLSAYIDHNHDGVADEEQVLVKNIAFTFRDRPADHTSNGVTLGIDGWLYLAIGDFGFMQAEGRDGTKLQFRSGGVVRVRTDGTGLEVYSRGTRNILEVAVDPLLNGFARDNTNDGGGWDIRLHHFSGLEQHGYPSLFKNFSAEIVQPLADYGGGSGCGALFMDEPGFPSGFGNALYTADWGRNWVYRHPVTPHGATFTAEQTEFVSVPRVTDLDVDAMSQLYVASWKGATFNYTDENVGYLVRVVPKGFHPSPLPNYEAMNAAQLAEALESPSHRRRLAAQRELIQRKLVSPARGPLEALAANTAKPLASRVAAVFAIEQGLSRESHEFLVRLSRDASIREYALRALTDHLNAPNEQALAATVESINDPSARVRLQAAVGLARLGNPLAAQKLTRLLGDSDPLVAHTAVQSLVALSAADAGFFVIDRADASPAERAGAVQVLQALHQTQVVEAILKRLAEERTFSRRAGLLTALCRLHFQEGVWQGNSWGTRPDTSGPYYQPEVWAASPQIAAALKSLLAHAGGEEAAFLVAELNRNKIQLDGSLDTIVAMAGKDRALLPAAIGQLSRCASIPAAAVPLLMESATADYTAALVRAEAVIALAKVDDPRACRAALQALASFQGAARRLREFEQARDTFLNAPKLDNQHDLLQSTAEAMSGPTSTWAEAALLGLSSRGSPESREQVSRSLAKGWADPKRRVQILKAVALARYRPYRERVLAALDDPDRSVASAAKQTADELRFQRDAKSTGPRIETLPVETVVAAVVREKGDRLLGEDLFARLSCSKCHTVRADEPLRGPFLGTIASTYKRRDLAESVLIPSKSIAQGFATNQFVLDDGRTLMGFVSQEAADKVTIRDLEGKEYEIPTASIEERVKQPLSMMPEGLVKLLTVREFASLLDYLESLPKK